MLSNAEQKFSTIALERGLITREELDEAIAELGTYHPTERETLDKVLVRQGLLTAVQHKQIVSQMRAAAPAPSGARPAAAASAASAPTVQAPTMPRPAALEGFGGARSGAGAAPAAAPAATPPPPPPSSPRGDGSGGTSPMRRTTGHGSDGAARMDAGSGGARRASGVGPPLRASGGARRSGMRPGVGRTPDPNRASALLSPEQRDGLGLARSRVQRRPVARERLSLPVGLSILALVIALAGGLVWAMVKGPPGSGARPGPVAVPLNPTPTPEPSKPVPPKPPDPDKPKPNVRTPDDEKIARALEAARSGVQSALDRGDLAAARSIVDGFRQQHLVASSSADKWREKAYKLQQMIVQRVEALFEQKRAAFQTHLKNRRIAEAEKVIAEVKALGEPSLRRSIRDLEIELSNARDPNFRPGGDRDPVGIGD